MLDPDRRAELVDAWQAWDASPGSPARAGRFLDAEHAAAEAMGWDWLPLARALTAARHLGYGHAAAVDLIDGLYDAGEPPAW